MSLADLDPAARAWFMDEFALMGLAIERATRCERVNYLILCNSVPWLHAHAVPRFADEPAEKRPLDPFEAYDFPGAPRADALGPDRQLHASLRSAVLDLIPGSSASLD